MQLGMIGLGRMGGNMTKRLEQGGHDVRTYDPGVDSTASTLAELRDQLDAPRRRFPVAALRVAEVRSAATGKRRRGASTSSTSASPAASGGSRSATA